MARMVSLRIQANFGLSVAVNTYYGFQDAEHLIGDLNLRSGKGEVSYTL